MDAQVVWSRGWRAEWGGWIQILGRELASRDLLDSRGNHVGVTGGVIGGACSGRAQVPSGGSLGMSPYDPR